MAKQRKRKPRGKAKPVPPEVTRIAHDIQRLRRLEACLQRMSHEKNRELVKWAKQYIGEQIARAGDLDDLSRALRDEESKAQRRIRSEWAGWNFRGLNWGERALEMSKLGFDEFKGMPRTSFESLCRRMKLKYAPVKMTQI